ncbi:hypothetical protein V8E54_002524 [Elaphomyces granulatus]
MDLRLSLISSGYDSRTRSWTIELQGQGAKFLGAGRIINPFTAREEDELTWYLHKFAVKEPFARGRAATVAQSLIRYRTIAADARCIESLLLQALNNESNSSPEVIVLSIQEQNTDGPSLQSLHWELLEDQRSWKEISIPVLFARWVQTPAGVGPGVVISSSSNPGKVTNILVVSARPGGRSDHPYRLISQPLWDLVHSDKELTSRIKIHFVRPGTWSALQSLLSNKELDFEFFSIVHFDTHGIVDKRGRYGAASDSSFTRQLTICSAGLYFSASNSNERRPVFIEASRVAALLSQSGVNTVVLNACETAKVTDSARSNLAQVFTTHGISNVVAMAFSLMASSAKIFMGAFYEKFLLGEDIQHAVFAGRKELREIQSRPGRYGVDVSMDDSCVPVLYQNHRGTMLLPPRLGPFPTLLPDSTCTLAGLPKSKMEADSAPPIIGRDADILLLEAAVAECKVINIVGDPGVGKTAFKEYVARWWESSNFVDQSFQFDFIKDKDIWSGSTIYGKILNVLGDPSYTRSDYENAIHRSRYAVFIDNFGVAPRNSLELPGYPSTNQLGSLLGCLRRFSEARKNDRCILIIFSRSRLPFADELAMKEIALGPVPLEDATSFAHQMIAQHSVNLDLSEASARHLEWLITFHNNNLLFLEIFIPILSNTGHTPQSILWDLQLGLPREARLRMDLFRDCANVDNSIEVKLSLSSLLMDFQSLVDFLKSQRPRCYWMLLSLALFHRSFPRMPLSWLIKLHEKGLLNGADCEGAKPKDLAIGTIHVHTKEVVTRYFNVNKEWPTDYEDLLQMLLNFGLGRNADAYPGCISYVDLHPLLPYMIRHEIASHPPPDGKNVMIELQTIVWEYYESLLGSLTIEGWPMNGAEYTYSKELSNILNSIKLCSERLQFGFREMRVLNVLPLIMWQKLPQVEIHSSLKVLTFVLERFEYLKSIQHFSRQPPTPNAQRVVMTQALMVVHTRGLLLYYVKNLEMIPSNTIRASDLLVSFGKSQRMGIDMLAVTYGIRCQTILFKSMPLVLKREKLKELITKPLENGGSLFHRTTYFDAQKVGVAIGYAFAQSIPEGSETPQEISATLSKAKDSLESYQKRLTNSGRIGRRYGEVINSLLEIIHSKNADQSILTALPQLKRSLSAVLDGQGLASSELEGISDTILFLGGGIREPEDLRHLENTMALARRRHDPGQEVAPLEAFFAEAIKISDYGAALLHHDRLRIIAQEHPNLRLTSITLQDGEGLRNFHIGRMLLDINARQPSKDSLTNLLQAEGHLQQAVRILNDDTVSRMELHQTLVALADCVIMLNDNSAVSIAYLLKAASLAYVSHPFSHDATRNGRVVEKMCHQWLLSASPGDFESQLATALLELGFVSSVTDPSKIHKFLEQCTPFLSNTPSREPAPVLQEAQFLAVRPRNIKRKPWFWTEDPPGDWNVNTAAIESAAGEHPNTIIAINNVAVSLQSQGKLDEAVAMEREALEKMRVIGAEHPETIRAASNLAKMILDQGKLDEAVTMMREVVEKRKRVLGEEHSDTIAATSSLATALYDQGKLDEAVTMEKEVVEKRKRILGEEHPDTIAATSSLAMTLYDQGKLDEAVRMQKEVVEKRKRILGEEHPDTITAMQNLGITLRSLGKHDEATTMQREVIEKRRKVLGEEHSDTIMATSILATALYNQGKLDEAVTMEKEVVEKRKRILGEEHPNTIAAISSLATTLCKQGKLDEAVTMEKEVVEKRKRVLGEEHSDTIAAISSLATTLCKQGKLDEAVTMRREVVEKRKRILGEEHSDTIAATSSLATTLYNQGKLDEAVTMEKEVVEKRKRILGEEHPDTIAAMNNLAVTLRSLGKKDEAATMESEVLKGRRNILGDEHPDTIAAMNNLATTLQSLATSTLATTLFKQGKLDEAVTMEKEVVEKRKRILGEEHSDTIAATSSLATTLYNQGKLDEAVTMEKEVVEKRKRILGEEHPDTIAAMNNLAVTLRSLGKQDEATTMQREVMEKSRKVLGEEHSDTIAATSSLATALCNQGKLDEAVTMRRAVVEKRKRVLGEEHPDTIVAMNNLAVTLRSLGKKDEAATMESEVLKGRRNILGDEHPDTIAAMNNLATTLQSLGKQDEAAAMQMEVMEKRRMILGEGHSDTIAATSTLATTLRKLDEAVTMEKEVVEKRKRVLGEEHSDTIAAISSLAMTLCKQGKLDEAVTMEKEVVEKRKRILGEEHSDTIAATSSLATTLYNQGKLDEAVMMEKEVVEKRKKVLGEGHPDTIRAMNNLAVTLGSLREREAPKEEQISLPKGWEARRTKEGRVYYVDHNTRSTSWVYPQRQFSLPEGWEARKTIKEGRVYYVDHKTRSTSWVLPEEGLRGKCC